MVRGAEDLLVIYILSDPKDSVIVPACEARDADRSHRRLINEHPALTDTVTEELELIAEIRAYWQVRDTHILESAQGRADMLCVRLPIIAMWTTSALRSRPSTCSQLLVNA